MTSPTRRTNSSRRSRKNQQMKTWFLGLLVLAMAGLILAGPKLFAQGGTQPQPAPTVEAPAPAPPPASVATPATPEPAPVQVEQGHGEAVKLPFGTVALFPLFSSFLPLLY